MQSAGSVKDFLKKTYAIRQELKSRANSVLSDACRKPLLKHPFAVLPQLLCRETRHLSVIFEEKATENALKHASCLPLTSAPPRSTSELKSCLKPRITKHPSTHRPRLPSARKHFPSRVLQRVYSPCPLDLSWFEEKKENLSRQKTRKKLVGVRSLAGIGPVLGHRSYRAKSENSLRVEEKVMRLGVEREGGGSESEGRK